MTPANGPLHPERALLTPTWLGALALLVANDHWLKGADLIPGVLTGKLSDFAGMLVAPALLATLLRVRTREGLLACHVAVGAVFAGIQLSPAFAQLWSGAMGLLGHPWAITCDPTDLLALPFLWLSIRLLSPAMAAERPALVGLQRSAVAAASVFGLWATVATSDDGGSFDDDCCGDWGDTGGGEPEWEEVRGQVYVHNPNEFAITLNIRRLRSDVKVDCSAIATGPGRLLPDDAFGDAEHWELPPTTNVGVLMPLACGAAKITGEGIPEQIVFATNLPSATWHPGSHASLDELGPLGAAIVLGESGGEWVGGENWRHTPSTEVPAQPEHCAAPVGERHFDWSDYPTNTVVEIQSVSAGLDGCYELALLPWAGENVGQPFTWYLCAPEAAVRFEVGQYYRFSGTQETVQAQLVDPLTQLVRVDDLGRPVLTMKWVRAMSDAAQVGVPLIFSVAPPTCPWQLTNGCVEVARRLDLKFDGALAAPGVPSMVESDGLRHEFILGRAQALALTDGSCGSDLLPHDLDYALISEPI